MLSQDPLEQQTLAQKDAPKKAKGGAVVKKDKFRSVQRKLKSAHKKIKSQRKKAKKETGKLKKQVSDLKDKVHDAEKDAERAKSH